jgi:hypothetical protein
MRPRWFEVLENPPRLRTTVCRDVQAKDYEAATRKCVYVAGIAFAFTFFLPWHFVVER